MAKFRKKPVVIEAITFDELVRIWEGARREYRKRYAVVI